MTHRQIVLCFDGTNNNLTGGREDTNVVKLCKLLAPSERQLVYYDPGVGNPGNIPGVTWDDKLRGTLQRLWGLAFGKGIYENIAEAYLFLMRHWQPGDHIYVFGFSRGAFTARSLAGMVARFGILRPSLEGMVPTLLHLYFTKPAPPGSAQEENFENIRAQIGRDFCTPEGARAGIWFVGVWDTVASVGSPFSRRRIHASGTIIGKRFAHVRQALALDEHRRSFEPRPYYIHPTHDYAATGQSIAQLWFSGSHCDVGGSHVDAESELSDRSFLWLLNEAAQLGLQLAPAVCPGGRLDAAAAASALRAPGAAAQPRTPRVHSEVAENAYWALAGLGVRDYRRAPGNRGDPPPKAPVAYTPPAGERLALPVPSVPPGDRAARLLVAIALGTVFWLLHAAAASGHTLLEQNFGSGAVDLAANLVRLYEANRDLALWQLGWWRSGADAVAHLPVGQIVHPVWMVLADLGFIACYSYVLAVFVVPGFAKAAGLRTVTDPPPVMLNRLGWSVTVIVLADLAEDTLMLFVLASHWLGWQWLQDVLALLMSVASIVKWAGFLPALALVLRGWRP